jgi:glycosyltransferase involved in cell wall biosynthesis
MNFTELLKKINENSIREAFQSLSGDGYLNISSRKLDYILKRLVFEAARAGDVRLLDELRALQGIVAFSVSEYQGVDARPSQPPDKPITLNRVAVNESLSKSFSKYTEDETIRLISYYFDDEFYRRTYWWDIGREKLDGIVHYIRYGADEGRDPSSWFSTVYYRTTRMIAGSRQNPLLHYALVDHGKGVACRATTAPSEITKLFSERVLKLPVADFINLKRDIDLDCVKRLGAGELADQVRFVAEIEPLISASTLDSRAVRRPFLFESRDIYKMLAIEEMFAASKFSKHRFVIFLPWIKLGGADREAAYLVRALGAFFPKNEILVVLTDGCIDNEVTFFPTDIKVVGLPKVTSHLNDVEKSRVIFEFVRGVRPQHIITINSPLFFNALRHYGNQLGDLCKIHTLMFCNDVDYFGDQDGYPVRYFGKFFCFFANIFTDSEYLRARLSTQYQIHEYSPTKLTVLRAPVDETLASYEVQLHPPEDGRATIFWAGRFDRQKRLDIVIKIARRCPQWIFKIWGKPVLNDFIFDPADIPANVEVNSPYQDLRQIELNSCHLWLYTSQWDGVPNLLVEVASLGIPIVGTNRGGGREIIDEGTSYIVDDIEDVDSYIQNIESAISDYPNALQRAKALMVKIRSERTFERFRETIGSHFMR